jgi:hypothetical protein
MTFACLLRATIRSDAIYITTSSIQTLPLPQLRHIDVQTWSGKALTRFNVSDQGQKNTVYTQFLAWLWDVDVEPILQHIGYGPHGK